MAKYVRDFDDFYKKTRRVKLKDISDTEPITLGGCDFDTGADAKEMIKNVRQDKWSMRFWKIRKYTIRFFKFIFLEKHFKNKLSNTRFFPLIREKSLLI